VTWRIPESWWRTRVNEERHFSNFGWCAQGRAEVTALTRVSRTGSNWIDNLLKELRVPTLYLESTIPSYLTAWPAKDLIAAAHQAITREWWELRRHQFNLHSSQLVVEEISAGDPVAAEQRLAALQEATMLPLTESVEWIAGELARLSLVPESATADGFHIAYASAHHMKYLLTWNCRHIANAERLPAIERFLEQNGLFVPIVCTPEELMGDTDEQA
jgi:hypothetical protein